MDLEFCIRSMVDDLIAENEELAARLSPISAPATQTLRHDEAAAARIAEWKLKHEEAAARVEQLELELEQQTLRGGFNPANTKVLHFRQNPLRAALEKEELRLAEIQRENEALKARYGI
jgi:hypothetical protein